MFPCLAEEFDLILIEGSGRAGLACILERVWRPECRVRRREVCGDRWIEKGKSWAHSKLNSSSSLISQSNPAYLETSRGSHAWETFWPSKQYDRGYRTCSGLDGLIGSRAILLGCALEGRMQFLPSPISFLPCRMKSKPRVKPLFRN